MTEWLDTHSTAQGCESLRIGDNLFRGYRLSRRVLTIFLLLIAGAVLLWPSTFSQSLESNLLTAKAQGNTSRSRTGARPQTVTRGATIVGKRLRIKSGYKFEQTSANTVAVALKSGGGITGTFTCTCIKKGTDGGTSCSITIYLNGPSCGPHDCAQCQWKRGRGVVLQRP